MKPFILNLFGFIQFFGSNAYADNPYALRERRMADTK